MAPSLRLLILTLAGLWVAGCTSTTSVYRDRANLLFAEAEIRARILQSAQTKYPEVSQAMRDAIRSGRATRAAKFTGTVKYGRPGPPMEKIWVTLVIDRGGAVISVDCTTDGEGTLKPAAEALIRSTTRTWRFTPATVDGQPVSILNIFPAYTDGLELYVSEARELQL